MIQMLGYISNVQNLFFNVYIRAIIGILDCHL